MKAERRTYPAPSTNVENERYFQAAAEGKLLIGKCKACNEVHHYPRGICPACMSTDVDWVPSAGKGTVYSFSVMRRAPVPYAIAYIRLDEGVTVITNIVDCDFDDIAVGQSMKVVFGETEDGHALPLFTPA